MKHIVIGDLHGKDCWRKIEVSQYDKIVFLGDYVDSESIPNNVIYQNLVQIIRLKKTSPEKVVLLLGNHDIQYLHFPAYICKGFTPAMQMQLRELFNENNNLFQVAYQCENRIFTHAGITNSWYKEFLRLPILPHIIDKTDTIADALNKVEQTGQRHLLHAVGYSRGGAGNGGITWADKEETSDDMLTGYHQVVGHTVTSYPENIIDARSSVTYINVLDTMTYFHEVDC